MNQEEGQLIQAVLNGNAEAYADLIRPYLAIWLKMATAWTGDRQDAEDAVQNALLQCYQGLGGFQARSRFSTWATRIVIRESQRLAHQRQQCAQRHVPLEWSASIKSVGHEGLVELCQTAHDALNPDERCLFEAALVEGRSVAELSRDFGVSPGTLKTRIWRLRKRLQVLFRTAQGGGRDVSGK